MDELYELRSKGLTILVVVIIPPSLVQPEEPVLPAGSLSEAVIVAVPQSGEYVMSIEDLDENFNSPDALSSWVIEKEGVREKEEYDNLNEV